MRKLLAVTLLLTTLSCTTTAEEAPVGLDQAVVRATPATATWVAQSGKRKVGSVVRYQEAAGPRRHLFGVRNIHDQDLGLIDASGRAWRLRPHGEPELLGTGTVLEGACRILGVEDISLIEGLQRP